jgi:hypothetical protein
MDQQDVDTQLDKVLPGTLIESPENVPGHQHRHSQIHTLPTLVEV